MLTQKKYLSLVAVASLSFSVAAADEEPLSAAATKKVNTPAAAQVFIDEDTGEIRAPTDKEKSALAEQFRRRYIDQAVDKPIVQHADGSRSQDISHRYRMYSVARISPDGKLEQRCLTPDLAADFLAEAESPAAQGEGSE